MLSLCMAAAAHWEAENQGRHWGVQHPEVDWMVVWMMVIREAGNQVAARNEPLS